MAKTVSFSDQKNLSASDAAIFFTDSEDALRQFFSNASPTFTASFFGMSAAEVQRALTARLDELDHSASMTLLGAIEAAFRVDYLLRCYNKERDQISRSMRAIHKDKEIRASLEDEILEVWKANITGVNQLIGDLRGAFKFRHWLAHGRYWTSKLGKQYDFITVYALAIQVTALPLLTLP